VLLLLVLGAGRAQGQDFVELPNARLGILHSEGRDRTLSLYSATRREPLGLVRLPRSACSGQSSLLTGSAIDSSVYLLTQTACSDGVLSREVIEIEAGSRRGRRRLMEQYRPGQMGVTGGVAADDEGGVGFFVGCADRRGGLCFLSIESHPLKATRVDLAIKGGGDRFLTRLRGKERTTAVVRAKRVGSQLRFDVATVGGESAELFHGALDDTPHCSVEGVSVLLRSDEGDRLTMAVRLGQPCGWALLSATSRGEALEAEPWRTARLRGASSVVLLPGIGGGRLTYYPSVTRRLWTSAPGDTGPVLEAIESRITLSEVERDGEVLDERPLGYLPSEDFLPDVFGADWTAPSGARTTVVLVSTVVGARWFSVWAGRLIEIAGPGPKPSSELIAL